jgi:hypothetical protein
MGVSKRDHNKKGNGDEVEKSSHNSGVASSWRPAHCASWLLASSTSWAMMGGELGETGHDRFQRRAISNHGTQR